MSSGEPDKGQFVSKAIGAEAAATDKFTLYVPNKGRSETEGEPQVELPNWQGWIRRALDMFCKINDGATFFPPARGVYLDQKNNNEEVWEDTAIVYSYIFDWDKFRDRILEVREFVRSFGKETRQASVMFELNGVAYQIEWPYEESD